MGTKSFTHPGTLNFAQNFWKGNNRGRYLLCSEPGPNSCHPPVFNQRGVLSKQHVRQYTLHLELLWIQPRYIAKDRKPKLRTNETIHRLHFQATDSRVRFVKVAFMPRLTMKQPKSQEQTWCPFLHQNGAKPKSFCHPFLLAWEGFLPRLSNLNLLVNPQTCQALEINRALLKYIRVFIKGKTLRGQWPQELILEVLYDGIIVICSHSLWYTGPATDRWGPIVPTARTTATKMAKEQVIQTYHEPIMWHGVVRKLNSHLVPPRRPPLVG